MCNILYRFVMEKREYKMKIFNIILGAIFLIHTHVVVSAPLKVKVTSGNFKPTPIAIMPFDDRIGDEDSQFAIVEMRDVIINNLLSSGLFENVNEDAFLETVKDAVLSPAFRKWTAINTDVLMTAQLNKQDDVYIFKVFLWDVNREISLFKKQYSIRNLKTSRRTAHIISDNIYSRVTGESPYFDSEIIFVDETKDRDGKTIKRLAVMDQDGYNLRYLTDGDKIVVTPRFSPSGKHLAYLSYLGDTKGPTAGIYFRDRKTGNQTFLSTKIDTSYAPQFAPDGKKMVFSYLTKGKSDIFVLSLTQAQFTISKLTDTKSIDTTPFYSPDGENIVFVSDRVGSPQLYTMKSDGSNQKRISGGDGAYTTPVWSPRGDVIAFTKQQGQEFCIGVMDTDGTNERLLTCSYLSEGPTFSPNGRVIMFFRQDKQEKEDEPEKVYLMSIDLTGNNLQRINTPHNASDPNWSVIKSRF